VNVIEPKNATFNALVRYDGQMVAAMVALPGGSARLFVRQPKETDDIFIGRISHWIKDQGGTNLEMQAPDVLPEGIEVGEVLMRIKNALGIGRAVGEASEYELSDATLVWSELQSIGKTKN
jgi:hypothetical protein